MGIKVRKDIRQVPTTRPRGAPLRTRPHAPRINPVARASATSTLLSILVPTVPGREPKLRALLSSLDVQVAARRDVELLVLRDNRSMSIGEKRNKMISLARGDFVAFCDDDDAVATDYVATICERLTRERPDVLCFTVLVRGYGPEKPCRYHPDFDHVTLDGEYRRKPNHIMVWRRELAASVPFPAIAIGEDTQWAEQIASRAERVSTIERALYIYQFDPNDNSTTPR